MKARLSMATRAFLLASLPMCLVLIASFFSINRAIRDRMKEGINETLHETGRTVDATTTDYNANFRELYAFLSENENLEIFASVLSKNPDSPIALPQLHHIIGTQLLELSQVSDYDLLVLSDQSGNPITGCVLESGKLIPLASFPGASVGQAPFCSGCHLSPVVNLSSVKGTVYEIGNMPIRSGNGIVGYLTIGKHFNIRSPSDFIYVALVENGRILLTTFPPGTVRELENQFRSPCAGAIDGCEIEAGGEAYLSLDAGGATLAGNSRLYGFPSMEAVMRTITPRYRQIFWLIGTGGLLLVLLVSTITARSLTKPITNLVDHLKGSERRGKLQPDFATNSSAKEVNLLAEALNHAAEAIRRSHEELQALAGRLLTAKEEENRRLARELHDVVSQRLAVLGMEVSAVERELGSLSPPASNQLRSMGKEVGRLAQDIHRLSRQLHPSILDHLGLIATLRAECTGFSKQHGITAELVACDVPDSLPPEVALSLYRIAQESLWNVAKHAQAQQVRLMVSQADGELLLAVEDDGKGFDLEQVKGQDSLGLVSMEERVRLVNGRFSIQSHPGKGTRVEVRVPLPRPEG